MKLAQLRCDCGKRELLAIAPGHDGVVSDLFRLTPDRRDIAYCETCWLRRFGHAHETRLGSGHDLGKHIRNGSRRASKAPGDRCQPKPGQAQ